MKCVCIGEGRGKWTCDPMPHCKVHTVKNSQAKREYKLIGASWITEAGNKKCKCVAKDDIKCIPAGDVTSLTVMVVN